MPMQMQIRNFRYNYNTIESQINTTPGSQNIFTLFIDNNLVKTRLLTSKKKYKLPLPESFFSKEQDDTAQLNFKTCRKSSGTTSMCIVIHIIPIVTDSSSSQVMRL